MRHRRPALLLIFASLLALAAARPHLDAAHAGAPLEITVNSTGDDPDASPGDGTCATAGAVCTIRAAIQEANTFAGPDTIDFDIPIADPGYVPASNFWRISPQSQLTAITGSVSIDARTQPGYDAAGRPVVFIDGTGLATEADGLELYAGNSLIAGLAISGFRDFAGGFSVGSQVLINGGAGNQLDSNFLGVDPLGQLAQVPPAFAPQGASPSASYRGAWVVNALSTIVSENLISGNSFYGLHIRDSVGTTVTENLIGTSPDGSADVGNGHYGVYVTASLDTSIGEAGSGNVISGNGTAYFDAGVFVFQPADIPGSAGASGLPIDFARPPGPPSASLNSGGATPEGFLDIRDNRIGTNAACTGAVPNVNGVIVVDAGAAQIDWTTVNVIGNTISGNGGGPAGPPAAFPDLLKPQGSPVIAGDGFVWGAPSPEGPVHFEENKVGADCDGQDPIPNQGRGAIIGLQVSSNTPPVPLAGAAPSLAPWAPPPEWFIEGNFFLANLLDCIDIDLFFDILDSWTELEVFLAFVDNALRNCGEDGLALSILLHSLSSWGDAIALEIESNEFSSNGADGLDVEFNGSPGNGPDVDLSDGEFSGNGGSGVGVSQWVNEYTVISANGGPPPDPPRVNISGMAIHDNGGAGIAIVQQPSSPAFGVAPNARRGQPGGASVTATTFYNNGGLAIDLGGDGVTENDPDDTDTGANGLLNFPVLTSAVGGSVTIAGTYDGVANTPVELRFYSNTACDPSGNGEGQAFIGSHSIVTDGAGHAAFEVTFDQDPPGKFITATATVQGVGTSEFSDCIEGEGIGGHLGDADCDGGVDSVDALGVLRHVAGLPTPACLSLADVNCDAAVNSVDALGILRFVAALPVNQQQSCPPIGP